ncbi:hypothetical protein Htur_4467 (plasmid) [Haloterrigena turkmenica DSM 5511]|uniref:Uncharacterized protein n=1 Tax=Haloterrigena turkmenica (strain ATCC 51198 / DSM 5511 / JCM 9101 / NCIMB 13204 / VKM B-1734 / 4k) TaxID=543526 RepID=D2S1N1_HALTV|nr:hypothetical protein Htur_4467 [Haloterrigena turkmenica DSM 5511]
MRFGTAGLAFVRDCRSLPTVLVNERIGGIERSYR